MKKIGVVVGRIDKGAAELLEVDLARNLTKLGYDVCLITMYSSRLFDDKKIEIKLNNEIHHIIRLNYDLKYKPTLLLKSIFQVKKLKLDCLISHNRGTDLMSFIMSIGTSTKHIKAFHEYFEKSHVVSFVDKFWAFVVRKADYTYHITQHSMIQNSKTFKLDKAKASVVQNVMDMKKVKEKNKIDIRALCKIPNKSKVILTVARLVPNKGIELNIEIAAPLLKQDHDLYYVLIGEKSMQDTGYYDSLMRMIHDYGLEKQVLFIGFQKNIAGLMRTSDVLLHFARHEAFGLVLIESLSAGLPIVASQVGGIPDVLEKSSFKTFPLDALKKARDELQKYLYTQKKENSNFSSNFDTRTSEQRAKEISLIIENVCSH